jgi:hypothetical protein
MLGAGRRELESHIGWALVQAVNRIVGRGLAEDRKIDLIVSEIATHERRHWHSNRKGNVFIDGRVLTRRSYPPEKQNAVDNAVYRRKQSRGKATQMPGKAEMRLRARASPEDLDTVITIGERIGSARSVRRKMS